MADERKTPAPSWLDTERRPKGVRKTRAERENDVHERALIEFDRIQSAMRDSRLQSLQDRRFYAIAGAQWEGPLQDQFANKPRFEANLIQLAITRIFNEYRNNRISVSFIPKDGSKNNRLADACAGLYRADEQDSVAEEAHDNGFEEGCAGGVGAWRLRAVHEDEENPDDETQRIRIEPIFDADSSVFFDLNAKRYDKADAKKCFVLTSMTISSYIEEYGDDPATWPKEIHQYEFDWATPDVVFIAEYYEVELRKTQVSKYQNLDGSETDYTDEDFREDDGLRERLDAIGSKQVGLKTQRTRKVHKYILSGSRILEDCGYIAGKCIPIVPYYGRRSFVDNVERCSGVVRTPKDMQRLLNMQLSKLGEIAAISSVEKPIFAPEQMQGHSELWSQDNIANYPYLLANPLKNLDGSIAAIGPLSYTKPPQVPAATAALLTITNQLVRDLLGNQDNADKIVSNISGKAVEMIQNRIDMQAYIYMSNMAKSVKREGEIWLSMAKELLTKQGRQMKSINGTGQVSSVTLLNPKVQETGAATVENDLDNADFDVQVTVGPSSESKRASTVRALTGMISITDDPQTRQVLTAMAMMNMEGDGIEDVREYFRMRLIKQGVVKPTPEEAQTVMRELANTPPSPESEALKAMAEQAIAEAKKANAQTIKTLADADLATAQTEKTRRSIDQKDTEIIIDAVAAHAQDEIETARAADDRAGA